MAERRHSPSASSGAATPTSASANSSSFLSSSSLYGALGGLMRRLSSDPAGSAFTGSTHSSYPTSQQQQQQQQQQQHHPRSLGNGIDGVYAPGGHRALSPMRPPPLEPLILHGFHHDTPPSARLLNPAVAEEIRIMIPERLRIEDSWALLYSLDQDGASLATLYQKCSVYNGRRGGFVLVIRDGDGGTFGAYLSDFPHPSPHFFGNGECFLWRAALVASSQPAAAGLSSSATLPSLIPDLLSDSTPASTLSDLSTRPVRDEPRSLTLSTHPASSRSDVEVPPPSPSIRFKAFPYSGVNEYYIYCESDCLSVGGGDGKYGLWLDDSLDKGVSSTCLTFGNEPLSDQGDKFMVLGVEVWVVGPKGA